MSCKAVKFLNYVTLTFYLQLHEKWEIGQSSIPSFKLFDFRSTVYGERVLSFLAVRQPGSFSQSARRGLAGKKGGGGGIRRNLLPR